MHQKDTKTKARKIGAYDYHEYLPGKWPCKHTRTYSKSSLQWFDTPAGRLCKYTYLYLPYD